MRQVFFRPMGDIASLSIRLRLTKFYCLIRVKSQGSGERYLQRKVLRGKLMKSLSSRALLVEALKAIGTEG